VLEQKFRLQGKEVIFLSRKRQYFSAGLFGFFYFQQYAQLPFHQLSFHVTIKFSKKSVERHVIKRAVLDYIQKQQLLSKPIQGKYCKFFVVMNKNRVEECQKKIANFSKKDIIRYIQSEFASLWMKLVTKLS
jgi:RNase P protein component